jgi:hypothetical protein
VIEIDPKRSGVQEGVAAQPVLATRARRTGVVHYIAARTFEQIGLGQIARDGYCYIAPETSLMLQAYAAQQGGNA